MPVLLPNICPKTVTLSAGVYASQGSQFASGISAIRRAANLPHTVQLAVDYGIILDTEAAALLAAWKAAYGTAFEVTLNSEIIDGIDSSLTALLPPDADWYFEEVPQVSSVFPGYSRASASYISDTRLPRG